MERNYNLLQVITYKVGKKLRNISRGAVTVLSTSKLTGYPSVVMYDIHTVSVHNFSYYRYDIVDANVSVWNTKERSNKFSKKLLKSQKKFNTNSSQLKGWSKGFYNIDRKEELGSTSGEAIQQQNFEIEYNLPSALGIITYILDLEEDELIEELSYLLKKEKHRDKHIDKVAKRVMGKSKDRQKLGTSVCSLFTYLSLLSNEVATPDNISFDPNNKDIFDDDDTWEDIKVKVNDTDEYVIKALDFVLRRIGTYLK